MFPVFGGEKKPFRMPQLHHNIDRVIAEQEFNEVLKDSRKRKFFEISQPDG
jgi:hypothetical protein